MDMSVLRLSATKPAGKPAKMLAGMGVTVKKRPEWCLPEQCVKCDMRDGL